MVVRLTYSVDRSMALFSPSDLVQRDVENHLREVISTLAQVREMRWPLTELFSVNDDFTKGIVNLLEKEICYCLFWGYLKKRLTEPGSDYMRWVFTKKEEDKNPNNWMRAKGDRWMMSDGRVKAIIEIEEGGPMTKISLSYDEDCGKLDGEFLPEDIKTSLRDSRGVANSWTPPTLYFIGQYDRGKPIDVAHLKNATSIADRIQLMKTRAVYYMEHHRVPIPTKEASNMERLEKLLWIK